MDATLGVVVAGGRGARLGLGRPKGLAELAGRTLLHRAVDLVGEVAGAVVVAAPPALELGPHAGARVSDAAGAEGPLAGIVGGLSARPHALAWIVGIDFPLLRAATLRALGARLRESGAAAVLPCPGGVPQPLVCAVARGAGERLADALACGERSATRALLALDPLQLDDDALAELGTTPEEFLNVNTPADLATAARALAARVTGAA